MRSTLKSTLARLLLSGSPLFTLGSAATENFLALNPSAVGINFQHRHGGTGAKEMIETMGSGCALLDYDNDGDLDIYFVNGAAIPSLRKEAASYYNRLYRNLGNFRFEDVTKRARVEGIGYGMGVAVGDYDNDGFPDLYSTNFGFNQLLHNRGDGTFEDVTRHSGVGAGGWSTSAAFLDFDRDGFLDIAVARYVKYEVGKGPYCGSSSPGARSYCLPDEFSPDSPILYRNNHNGTFSDVSGRSGLGSVRANGLGIAVADVDGDGWSDILFADDRTRNLLFRNKADGTFEEIGIASGLAYSNDGVARAGMGIDVADFDGDGLADVIVSNFESEGVALFRNHGSLAFYDEAGHRGLLQPSFPFVGFGIRFLDYDNDGRLDVLSVNGHVLDDISRYRHGMQHSQPKLLFRNDSKRFMPVPFSVPASVARGLAAGDLDNDGDVDAIVCNNNSVPEILKNISSPRHHSVLVRLIGVKSNRDGFGAKLQTRLGSDLRVVEVGAAGSYLSSNDPRIHLGLGDRKYLQELKLQWPSGATETIGTIDAGFVYAVAEGKGLVGKRRRFSRDSRVHWRLDALQ